MVSLKTLNLDKTRVKDVYMSLRKANREMLRANKIDENIDDFVYLTLTMKQPITKQEVTQKPPKPTPIQLALPFPLVYTDTLFLCKEGQREKILTLIEDLGFGAKVNVEELTKKLKPSILNKFDHLLIDSSIKASSKLFKRRHFPWPIDLKSNPAQQI